MRHTVTAYYILWHNRDTAQREHDMTLTGRTRYRGDIPDATSYATMICILWYDIAWTGDEEES